MKRQLKTIYKALFSKLTDKDLESIKNYLINEIEDINNLFYRI